MTEQKIMTNWDGKPPEKEQIYERVVVTEGEHRGSFNTLNIVDIMNYDKTAKQKTFIFTITLDGEDKKELPFYLNPKIKKGNTNTKTGETYSNSKLYDLLKCANLIEDAKKTEKEQDGLTEESLQLFLSSNLVGKKLRFSSKTLHKDNEEKKYSAVDKIYEIYMEEA